MGWGLILSVALFSLVPLLNSPELNSLPFVQLKNLTEPVIILSLVPYLVESTRMGPPSDRELIAGSAALLGNILVTIILYATLAQIHALLFSVTIAVVLPLLTAYLFRRLSSARLIGSQQRDG